MKKTARNSIQICSYTGAFLALSLSASAHAAEIAARVVTVRGEVLKHGEWNLTHKNPLKANETILSGDVIESKKGGSEKLLFTDKTIVDIGSDTVFKVKEYQLKQGGNRAVTLELPEGKVRTSVNQPVGQGGNFRLKTRSVVMGVRGTEFVVESREVLASAGAATSAPTQITVLEGNVAVAQVSPGSQGAANSGGDFSANTTQSVSAGQQLTAGVSASPQAGTPASGAPSTSSPSSSSAAPVGGTQPSAPSAVSPGVQTLSSAQVAQVAQSATVVDNTFKASVDLEAPAQSSPESAGRQQSQPAEAAPRPPALAQLAAVVQNSTAQPPPRIDVGNLGVPGVNSTMPATTNTQMQNFSVVGQPTSVKIRFTP